ncbi:hypothetical protein EC973_006567 [Apophysomyces ossiformis]|uniref:Ribosomal RNA large subunit methyltransferase K/L-like methyltransferase domain-containing protein n=1 Tax=Apophysomyces ossiformis TaxID=679940 RepID=A0A8H7BV42_9FUNG|nr:hypothetical protein EC973_006567 [Apophysomyces ossiformis]
MSTNRSVHILFHVPEGLELVAAEDIKETLAEKVTGEHTYVSEAKTGRVHLLSTANELQSLVAVLRKVHILSVYSVIIIASECTIPRHVFANEEDTYKFISSATESANWARILNAISSIQNEDPSPPTFRATFQKGQLKHPAKSQELAGYVGFAFSKLYPSWKVKLTKFDHEIVALWFQSSEKTLVNQFVGVDQQTTDEDDPILVSLGLAIPIPDPKYRNRLYLGRTSLNPCIAYCLGKLANPQPGQVVLDMCCGTGTIPIEGGSRFPNSLWIGSEVKVKTLSLKAQGNVEHARVTNVELMLGDGRQMCLRKGCIDIVVSDWPWGLREGSYSTIQKLYPKFIRQIHKVLQPEGKAYIVTQEYLTILGVQSCGLQIQ